MPFRTLRGAIALRNHVIHVLEEADVEEDTDFRRRLLTFVVGGGGFWRRGGRRLNDFLQSVKKNYLRLRGEQMRCVLVHSRDRDSARNGRSAGAVRSKNPATRPRRNYIERPLDRRHFRKGGNSGLEFPVRRLSPRCRPPRLRSWRSWIARKTRRLLVSTRLELQRHEGEVWVLGDCAPSKPSPAKSVPPTAQHAEPEKRPRARPTSLGQFEEVRRLVSPRRARHARVSGLMARPWRPA